MVNIKDTNTAFLSDAILVVTNSHIDSSPPCVKNAPAHYLSYFENRLGEQWIFTHERGTNHFTLKGGDIGWDSVSDLSELVLGVEEQSWVVACLWACGLEDMGTKAIQIFEDQKRLLQKASRRGKG